MRKTILYLVILAVLGAGIYYMLPGRGGNNGTAYDAAEAGFGIQDTAAIGKLYLVATDGSEITVVRTAGGWLVNNKYPVLRSTLYQLLSTLHKQEALYPVTKKAYDNVIRDMASGSIKVEVYDRAGKKMKVFYVGGSAVNNSGTNMLMEGAKTPYVVHVPGFVGYLTPQYATKMKDWRDRTVFNLPAAEIKTISVQYAGHPENSFEINQDNGQVTVTADKEVMNRPGGLNTDRARLYLRFFGNINSEGYINGLPDNDTTLKTAPKQSTIDITGIHGQHQHADIYWMELNRRSKNLYKTEVTAKGDVSDNYDADRLYAVINNNQDTIVIQQFAFRNIFRKAKEFYTKDVPPAEQPAAKKQ